MVMNRHGVMIIGQPMSGKSSALKLLQATHNAMNIKELKERQKNFLKRKAEARGVDLNDKKSDISLDSKGDEKQSDFTITPAEDQMIKLSCRHQGITKYVINPKSQSVELLMGRVDPKSQDYKDGILPWVMRKAVKEKIDRKCWIILDGSLEAYWVENLNSVLDDNRKLTVVTGECIPLSVHSTIIIESQDLKNCSPATVSRCGIISMTCKSLNIKAMFNHYINNLPTILSDQAVKFDQMVNYFFPELLDKYLSNVNNLIYPITDKYAV